MCDFVVDDGELAVVADIDAVERGAEEVDGQ